MAYPFSLPLGRTRATLLWERAYAAITPILAVIAGFLGLALWGVWDALPPILHLAGLLGFFAMAVTILVRSTRLFRWPRRSEVEARLEADAALTPGLLRDLSDTPFDGDDHSAFWEVHQRRLATIAFRARPKKARALIDKTDPYALRYGALLVFGLGLVIAGTNAPTRLATAFAPFHGTGTPLIADIWISPPDYTGKAPQFLVRAAPLEKGTAAPVTVPAGSIFHARLTDTPGGPRRRPRAILATEVGQHRLSVSNSDGAYTVTAPLTENSALSLKVRGQEIIWPIEVLSDTPPTVRWSSPPEIEGGTRTMLFVEVEDDYGVAAATLSLRLAVPLNRPPDAPTPAEDTITAAETMAIPALRGPAGARRVALDLTDHPWAGLPISLAVTVIDGAGQQAETASLPFTLPSRTFYNPLARTVIEERQKIALSPDSWRRTARLFDALTFAPDRYAKNTKEYLLLRTAFHDVNQSAGDNTQAIIDSFWPLAIALEDEGLTLARQRLEAAQAALREALARNAPPEEIDQLIEALRQAMDDYVAALAASGDANAPAGDDAADMNERDLDDILDEIAELRRQGDTREARQRLSELEQLLQNLQISPGGSSSGEGQQAAGQSGQGQGSENGDGGEGGEGAPLNQAGSLIDAQRRLSDETFAAERGDRDTEGLAAAQQALADAAESLAGETTQADGTPGGDGGPEGPSPQAGARAFGDAAEQMAAAASALGRGDLRTAQGYQEQALAALRQGAEALADAAEAAREGDGSTEQSQSAGGRDQNSPNDGRGQAAGPGVDRDPLGRLYGQEGDDGIEIPDLTAPERIRDLTESLRRRLADPDLSAEERDYLERLLKRF